MSSFLLFLQICYWQLLKNRLDIMNLSSETPQGSTSVFFFFHKSFPPSSLSLFFFYSDPVLVADSQDCCLKLLTPQAPRFSPSLSFFFFSFFPEHYHGLPGLLLHQEEHALTHLMHLHGAPQQAHMRHSFLKHSRQLFITCRNMGGDKWQRVPICA